MVAGSARSSDGRLSARETTRLTDNSAERTETSSAGKVDLYCTSTGCSVWCRKVQLAFPADGLAGRASDIVCIAPARGNHTVWHVHHRCRIVCVVSMPSQHGSGCDLPIGPRPGCYSTLGCFCQCTCIENRAREFPVTSCRSPNVLFSMQLVAIVPGRDS